MSAWEEYEKASVAAKSWLKAAEHATAPDALRDHLARADAWSALALAHATAAGVRSCDDHQQ